MIWSKLQFHTHVCFRASAVLFVRQGPLMWRICVRQNKLPLPKQTLHKFNLISRMTGWDFSLYYLLSGHAQFDCQNGLWIHLLSRHIIVCKNWGRWAQGAPHVSHKSVPCVVVVHFHGHFGSGAPWPIFTKPFWAWLQFQAKISIVFFYHGLGFMFEDPVIAASLRLHNITLRGHFTRIHIKKRISRPGLSKFFGIPLVPGLVWSQVD